VLKAAALSRQLMAVDGAPLLMADVGRDEQIKGMFGRSCR
jgi:hypothetical protein